MTSEKRHEKARGRLAGLATAAIGASILLTITIGLLGPSPMVPALTGPSWQPPYSLDVHPNPYLVIAFAAAAIILGGLGLLTALTLTRPRKLLHPATSPPTSPKHTTSPQPTPTQQDAPQPPAPGADGIRTDATGTDAPPPLAPGTAGPPTDTTGAAGPPTDTTGAAGPRTDAMGAAGPQSNATRADVPQSLAPGTDGSQTDATRADALQPLAPGANGSQTNATRADVPQSLAPGTAGPRTDATGTDVPRAAALGVAGALSTKPGALSARLWTLPSARLLVLIGCTAAAILAFLPPSGSGDHLNYAAYGRMVTLGLSPYTHGAVDLPGDPIADAVEEPWREEPSVYGPVATAVQAMASWIGGDSLRLTIFVLALFNAAAFIATGLLIDRFTRDDPTRRLRAALLWTANPLLLYQLVAGMHVDTLAIACMVAALLARSRPTGSGVLLGLGVAIKVNAGLVALGPAWELRRRPARLALMAACALAVVVIGYALVGPEAIAPMTRTSKSISHASFWKLVQGWLQSIVGTGSAYRGEIQIGSLLVLALLAWSLLRLASRSRQPGLPRTPTPSNEAPVVAAGLMVAYVFATPYVLPWYDGLALGLLALVAASAVDGFVVAHLLVLSLAYLPARVEGQPEDLDWLREVVRPQLAWALLALTVALVVWAWRTAKRERLPSASVQRGEL